MTTYFEEDYASGDDREESAGLAVLINWAGAMMSLALIAGLAVWGYQLLVRDVSGVPVVRALEGPMRVAPEDPGGTQADYQDLSVTEVAAAGAEEDPTERVVLAPPPVTLADEDKPLAALVADTPSAPAVEPDKSAAVTGAEAAADDPGQTAIELAIAEALLATEPETASAFAGRARRVTPAMAGGVAQSPRPVPRPALPENAVALSTVPTVTGGEIDVAEIAPGTRLVQLGAFPSPDEARAAWDRIEAGFGPYFEGKRRVVQEASAGGSSFWRLRAFGFEDLDDARRFCAVLVAEDANCIPVIRR